jgi:hypothetical protein
VGLHASLVIIITHEGAAKNTRIENEPTHH